MNIQQEIFEAWLFAQDDGAEYDYKDNENCLVCQFIKQTTNVKDARAGGGYWRDSARILEKNYGVQPFPDWLADFELKFVGLKRFGQVKEAYIKHFGNPLANTEMVELPKPTTCEQPKPDAVVI